MTATPRKDETKNVTELKTTCKIEDNCDRF